MAELPGAEARELASVIGGHCPIHGAPLEPDCHLELWQDWRAQQEGISSPGAWCEPCGAWWLADPAAQTVSRRWPFPRREFRDPAPSVPTE